MSKKKKYIGEILVEKGLITNEQLKTVLEEQMRNKQFLGEMFVKKGIISEDALLETLAEQFNVGYVQLGEAQIDWEGTKSFSSALIIDHKCIPLSVDSDTVTVAISNPLNAWVVDMAQKEAAPRKLKIVLAKVSDIERAIASYRQYSLRTMMNKWRKQ